MTCSFICSWLTQLLYCDVVRAAYLSMMGENNGRLNDTSAMLPLSPVGLWSWQLLCKQCGKGSQISWYIHDWLPPAVSTQWLATTCHWPGSCLSWSSFQNPSHHVRCLMHTKHTAAWEVKTVQHLIIEGNLWNHQSWCCSWLRKRDNF